MGLEQPQSQSPIGYQRTRFAPANRSAPSPHLPPVSRPLQQRYRVRLGRLLLAQSDIAEETALETRAAWAQALDNPGEDHSEKPGLAGASSL